MCILGTKFASIQITLASIALLNVSYLVMTCVAV